ncbi:expansin EXLX1 family cellulose-binding protein [Leptothrix discophora]|uniref:Expansin EXLX1 family cellulose-binding protein n=1 Tax=Leptothrix discophora TaxID=89 RepID=A0ABT9G6I1_LEPDI|nr:expansin EXLX1 family cellulose-binding protein [Leptothrix discophora]MDP4302074.1 expansin EXLX1 family cellulose-binding protein [Leptothrix discophora]
MNHLACCDARPRATTALPSRPRSRAGVSLIAILTTLLVACGGGGSGGGGGGGGGSGGADPAQSPGTAFVQATSRQGEGTYYDYAGLATGAPATAGACGYGAVDDRLIAAMNQADYADSAACGAQIVVTGPKGSVTVRVVDRCPECAPGDVDLSAEAFARIAEPVAGRVGIRWHGEPASIGGPVAYRYKEGSSRYWVAIQVRNHRLPIAKLEIRPSGTGSWIPVARTSYNYFEHAQDVGNGPLDVRITASDGSTLQDSLPAPASGLQASGRGQFP